MKRRIPFHPPLIAAFPILSLYSANLAIVPLDDLWHPLFLAMGGSLLAWLVVGAVFRNVARGAAIASALIVAVFVYGKIVTIPAANHDIGRFTQLAIWTVVSLLVLWLLGRRAKKGDWQTPALNVLGTALVASSLGSVFFGLAAEKRHLAELTPAKETGSPVATGPKPDIFYIVLDGYGRQDQLQRVFGFDNSAFVKALESRGFYVANKTHANYCQTEISLASSLNLDYIPTLLPKMKNDDQDRSPLDALVQDSEVARHLRAEGYKTVAITSGFPPFKMRLADQWLHEATGRSLFEDAVIQLTPFEMNDQVSSSMFDQRREELLAALKNLGDQAPRTAVPRFIFAHILMPHPPFVFDKDGNAAKRHSSFGFWDGSHFYEYGGKKEEYHQGYVGQVEYLNKCLLPVLDQIQKAGQPKPIILIQGDHGSKMNLDQENVEKTDLNECFSNLSAYYLPPEMQGKLDSTITPVNSFRLIFNGLFGETRPVLPDKSWYSGNSFPYKMIEVTDRVKAP